MEELALTPVADVKQVAVLGGGVIGSGWAALFAARGLDVHVHEPDAARHASFHDAVETGLSALGQLDPAQAGGQGRIIVARNMDDALAGAEFVQECAPDRLDLKRSILNQADRLLPRNIVIASSTSGLPMTEMQDGARYSDRMVVGHPFNPPYLIPLVEVVAGMKTSPAVTQWAAAFYSRLGKKPLILNAEPLGFIANRLQEALWREALHMIAGGEATPEQIDFATIHGPGLRWALMGPCLTFHLGGGDGGIRHFLEHFADALEGPWCHMKAPALDAALIGKMADGCDRLAGPYTMTELARQRDAKLVDLLKAAQPFPEPQSS